MYGSQPEKGARHRFAQAGTRFVPTYHRIGMGRGSGKKGFFKSLFGNSEEYELDAIAFLLGPDGKIANPGKMDGGKPMLVNGDVVIFNSTRLPSGSIWLTGDNCTGAGMANCCSMTFAEEVSKDASSRAFNAIGAPHESDRFFDLLLNYLPRNGPSHV